MESKETPKSDFLNSEEGALLKFPSLTWVVQNFFQQQLPGETPTKWLHRLLRNVAYSQQVISASITSSGAPMLLDHPSNDEHEDEHNAASSLPNKRLGPSSKVSTADRQKSNLMHIFEPMEAVTMDIPSYDREILRDLSKAKRKDLSTSYLNDLNNLWSTIEDALELEQAKKQLKTGSTLYSLLNVLIGAANRDRMDTIPQMWQLYIDSQKHEAKSVVENIFQQRAYTYDTSVPLSMKVYANELKKVAAAANMNVDELLFGLSTKSIEIEKKIIYDSIQHLKRQQEERNLKQIRKFVEDKAKLYASMAESELEHIDIPTASKNIEKDIRITKKKVIIGFEEDVAKYEKKWTSSYREQLEKSIRDIKKNIMEENRNEMEKILKIGRSNARLAFIEIFQNANFPGIECHVNTEFIALKKSAIEAGTSAFDAATVLCTTEMYYQQSKNNAIKLFETMDEKFQLKNNVCIGKQLKKYTRVSLNRMKDKSNELRHDFPIFDDVKIKNVHQRSVKSVIKKFQKSGQRFYYHHLYEKHIKELRHDIQMELKYLQTENDREIKKTVDPVIRGIKDMFDLTPSMAECKEPFYGKSCRKWFKNLVTVHVTQRLKKTWAGEKKKLAHIPRVVVRFLHDDLKRHMKKCQKRDATNKNKMNIVYAMIAGAAGILMYKMKTTN